MEIQIWYQKGKATHSFLNPVDVHKIFPALAVKEIVVKELFCEKRIIGEDISETLIVYSRKIPVKL